MRREHPPYDCTFCQAAQRGMTYTIVYGDEQVYAMMRTSLHQLPHTLIVPRFDHQTPSGAHIRTVARQIIRQMAELTGCEETVLAVVPCANLEHMHVMTEDEYCAHKHQCGSSVTPHQMLRYKDL